MFLPDYYKQWNTGKASRCFLLKFLWIYYRFNWMSKRLPFGKWN